MGIVCDPLRKEHFEGVAGIGACPNSSPISVSSAEEASGHLDLPRFPALTVQSELADAFGGVL